jgi:hypothetical protein
MNYSIYLALAAATVGPVDSPEPLPPSELDDVLQPVLQRLRQLILDFRCQPVSPQATFDFERRLQDEIRELTRVGLEWAYNHVEATAVEELPTHVQFQDTLYTRGYRKTPQTVATTCGKIRLWRLGYRPTHQTGEPTLFLLAQQLGLVAGASPALAERVAFYQAEAGATQRRTLQRLRHDHGVDWGVKKLREVTDRVSRTMVAERHEVQVEQLQHWLERAYSGSGKHKPVLSLGRDGICVGVPVRGGTIFEVASAGTVTVLNRRGKRLGTVYLACMPEPKQGTMSEQLTRLVEGVLQGWQGPLPRLCYVTDAGDNETSYYQNVLRRMCHPRTGERLQWTRVLDYYHASERLWSMAEALLGSGPSARSWVRRMQQLLKQPGGIRRVLNSASVLRSGRQLGRSAREAFGKAYNYLRARTKYMDYACYERWGLPRGSGVTEAACKTIYTQRLKLSGMRWQKSGAQTILNLRVLLLSGVWSEAYRRGFSRLENVQVPPYAMPSRKTQQKAA